MNCPDNLKQEAVEKAAQTIAESEGYTKPLPGELDDARAYVNAVADDLFTAGYEAGIKTAREAVESKYLPDTSGPHLRPRNDTLNEVLAALPIRASLPKGKEDRK